ncbi:MAG: hypothetical protein KAS94_01085, partial [Desulfobulbaceae bacterium]|nr:hypothetical protein [Desulfobulbaceae bacterium]
TGEICGLDELRAAHYGSLKGFFVYQEMFSRVHVTSVRAITNGGAGEILPLPLPRLVATSG